MTEFLDWGQGWLINIAQMDEDHEEISQLLNRLAVYDKHISNDSEHNNDTTSFEDFLNRYDDLMLKIREHFDHEETFMESINYPKRHEHKREHTVQMAAFIVFRNRLSSQGLADFEREDLNWIKMWFLDHVFSEDQEYADYYRENNPD